VRIAIKIKEVLMAIAMHKKNKPGLDWRRGWRDKLLAREYTQSETNHPIAFALSVSDQTEISQLLENVEKTMAKTGENP
jgi:hypothetical protein